MMLRLIPGALFLVLTACQSPAAVDPPQPDLSSTADTDPHDILFRKALEAQERGDAKAALDAYQAALSTPPNNPFEFLAVSRIQLQLQRLDEALATVEAGLSAYPGDEDLTVRRAQLVAARGDVVQARALLAAVLAGDPSHLGARFAAVEVELASGNADAALSAARTIVAEMADEAEGRLWLSRALWAKGDAGAAVAEAKVGLELAGDCECTAEVREKLREALRAAGQGAP